MPRAALSALCALPLASAAAPLDTFALLQGSAHVERQLPKQLADMYLAMQHQQEAVKKEKSIKDLGDFAWNSGTMAVRLPDSMPSQAWGSDALKGVSAYGMKKGGFMTGGLLSTGTDTKESFNALGGLAYTGLDPKNEQKLPTTFGMVASGDVSPGRSTFVGAVPVEDKKDGPGLAFLKAVTKVETGHLSPDKVPQYLGGKAKAMAASSAHAPAKVAQKAVQASSTPAPAQKEEKAVATTAPAPAKEGPKVASLLAVQEEQQAAATSLEEQQANATEPALSPEQEKANQEWGMYTLKLLFLEFPIESAYWFAVMRSWAKDHPAPADEAFKRLAQIQGRWRVKKDSEVPAMEGKDLTIQDGKLFSAEGEHVLETTFQAYTDQKYGAVSALKTPLDNSTVSLYKLFHVNGTQLEFEGGNIWERLSPAPAAAASTEGPEEAAKAAKAGGAELLRQLGGALLGSAGQEQAKKVGSWLRNLQGMWKH